jgi:hypothetical protein
MVSVGVHSSLVGKSLAESQFRFLVFRIRPLFSSSSIKSIPNREMPSPASSFHKSKLDDIGCSFCGSGFQP